MYTLYEASASAGSHPCRLRSVRLASASFSRLAFTVVVRLCVCVWACVWLVVFEFESATSCMFDEQSKTLPAFSLFLSFLACPRACAVRRRQITFAGNWPTYARPVIRDVPLGCQQRFCPAPLRMECRSGLAWQGGGRSFCFFVFFQDPCSLLVFAREAYFGSALSGLMPWLK